MYSTKDEVTSRDFQITSVTSKLASFMYIVVVAHGNEPIPPTGWGAVEQVIWQYDLRLRQRGHSTRIINKRKLSAILNVIGICFTRKVDVIHCHAEKPLKALTVLSKLRNVLLVSTLHHPLNPESPSRSEIKSLKRCQVAPYHFVLREDIVPLIKEHNPNAICKVLPNGVEVHDFHLKPQGNGRVCCIGRIQERKRQNDTALMLKGSGIECDFIGPVMEDVNISEELRRQMVGEWDRDTLRRGLSAYSCLVLLSHSEGQPLAVVEALAAGIPVVVSKAAAANLDTSLPFVKLVEKDEQLVPSIKEAILLRDSMSLQIRKYAEENFDYDPLVDQYILQLETWLASSK
jgi:glycosyltransferase involved in cell wall biosynthesis